MKKQLKRFVHNLPYIRRLKSQLDQLHVPPGHYYSPTISVEDLISREDKIWKPSPRDILGLDLNEDEQLGLLNDFVIL